MRHESEAIYNLLAQQKRYIKIIQSYQRNDLSEEYTMLRQQNDKLTDYLATSQKQVVELQNKIEEQQVFIQQVTEEKQRLEQELEQLKKQHKSSDTHDLLQMLTTEEIYFHFQAIYYLYNHWISLTQTVDKEVDELTETDEKMKRQNEANTLINSLNKHAEEKGSTSLKRPKTFHFKDLQVYNQAYILPQKKQTDTNDELALFNAKTKLIKKIKENQFKKSSSLNLPNKKKQDHLNNHTQVPMTTVDQEMPDPSSEALAPSKDDQPHLPTTPQPDTSLEQTIQDTQKKNLFHRILDIFVN